MQNRDGLTGWLVQRVRTMALGTLACAVGAVLLTAAPAPVSADEYEPPRISITDGTVRPMPIAVTDFVRGEGDPGSLGEDIAGVVSADLERSGLFAPIEKNAFIQQITSFEQPIRFGDWRVITAEILVTGRVRDLGNGEIQVAFRLWDVTAQRNMLGFAITVPQDAWRRAAHMVSDQIYEALTGEKGYFDTRIVYISESGPKVRRVKRLMIMDQDGANPLYLTKGEHIVLTPRFSPTNPEIVYLSYATGLPRVYLLDIESGQQEVVGEFPGMTFSPRFSPDGQQVIMSLMREGNTDIYVRDLRTRQMTRLTHHRGIDTSPSYSPDGRFVTFESNRGGSQQIYTMRSNGTQARRISNQRGRYGTPVWSPRGDLIAFTKIWRGKFYIGVMRTDGSGERLLTESFLDEGPTWSPNGRVIMFARTEPTRADGSGGEVKLMSVDLTGHNLREIRTIANASDPAWSGLLTPQR